MDKECKKNGCYFFSERSEERGSCEKNCRIEGEYDHDGSNEINLSLYDFTTTPGPRCGLDGNHSAQEWRDVYLGPLFKLALKRNSILCVDLDGVQGLPHSFLEEAFGGLVRYGFKKDDVFRLLQIECSEDQESIDFAWKCIEEAVDALTVKKILSKDLYINIASKSFDQMKKSIPKIASNNASFGLEEHQFFPSGFILRRGDSDRDEDESKWIFELFISIESSLVKGSSMKFELDIKASSWDEAAIHLLSVLDAN